MALGLRGHVAGLTESFADVSESGKAHNEAVGTVITDFGNLEELAPTPMFALLSLSRDHRGLLAVSEDQAAGFGMPLALVVVAAGVFLLIRRAQAFVTLKHLTEGRFTRDPVVTAWALRLRADNEGPRSRALALAVGLWVLAAVPLATAGALSGSTSGTDYSPMAMVLSLVMVASGLRAFLPTTWASATHSTLSQQGRAPGEADDAYQASALISSVAAAYWPLTVVAYLAWSFIWDAWDRSWIIWPLAAVLFGALAAGASAWGEHQRKRRG